MDSLHSNNNNMSWNNSSAPPTPHLSRNRRMVCVCVVISMFLIIGQSAIIFIPEIVKAMKNSINGPVESTTTIQTVWNKSMKRNSREFMKNDDITRLRPLESGKRLGKLKTDDDPNDNQIRQYENSYIAADSKTMATAILKGKQNKSRLRKRGEIQPDDSTTLTEHVVATVAQSVKEELLGENSNAIISHNQECNTSREPIWEYDNYSEQHHTTKASKKLLIGLYSGFGLYSQLLTQTAHINRAYAQHWHHDVVLVQGAALRLHDMDGDCEPPHYRAAYDKIALLQYALQHKDNYDQLLILDTDALIYDMNFDVTTLLPEGRMLAAHKVRPKDNPQTWDINNGVTLWNLHHPRIEQLTEQWHENFKNGMINNHHASNDQYHLHAALKKGQYEEDIFALVEEFKYGHGTVIKHFIRSRHNKQWGSDMILDDRGDRIALAIDKICTENKRICDSVEKRIYKE